MVHALLEKTSTSYKLPVSSPYLPITFLGFSVCETKTQWPGFPNPLLMFLSPATAGMDTEVWNYIYAFRSRRQVATRPFERVAHHLPTVVKRRKRGPSTERHALSKRAMLRPVDPTPTLSDRPPQTAVPSLIVPVLAPVFALVITPVPVATTTHVVGPGLAPAHGATISEPDTADINAALKAHRDPSKSYCNVPDAVTKIICNQACAKQRTLNKHHDAVHLKGSVICGVMRTYTATVRALVQCTYHHKKTASTV